MAVRSRPGLSWTLRFLVVLASSLFGCDAVQFDYFLFTREWPGTLCNNMHCRARPSNISIWTIHGLWPQYNNNSWPQFCDPGNKFSLDEVKDLLDRMNVEWPNLLYTNLWVHEWERHGTCALSVFSSQHAYFAASLQLEEKYGLQDALTEDGIVPSATKEYRIADVHKSLDRLLGSAPQIQCVKGELNEVRMCVTKKLQPFDCPVKTVGCPALVKLPPFPESIDAAKANATEVPGVTMEGHDAAAVTGESADSSAPTPHMHGMHEGHGHAQQHMQESSTVGSMMLSDSSFNKAEMRPGNHPSTIVVVENVPGLSKRPPSTSLLSAGSRVIHWVSQASVGKQAVLLNPTVIAAVFLAVILLAGSALALVTKPTRTCGEEEEQARYLRLRSRSSSYCDMEAAPCGSSTGILQ